MSAELDAQKLGEYISDFFTNNIVDGMITDEVLDKLAKSLQTEFGLTEDEAAGIIYQIISGGEGEEGEFDYPFFGEEGEFDFPFGFGEGEDAGFDFGAQ